MVPPLRLPNDVARTAFSHMKRTVLKIERKIEASESHSAIPFMIVKYIEQVAPPKASVTSSGSNVTKKPFNARLMCF